MRLTNRIRNAFAAGKLKATTAMLALMAAPAAMADGVDSGDDFYELYTVVHDDWIEGGLGVTLAFIAFLVGIGFAVAKNNPMMAVGGLVIAAMIAFIPPVIADMVAGGALVVGV